MVFPRLDMGFLSEEGPFPIYSLSFHRLYGGAVIFFQLETVSLTGIDCKTSTYTQW